jgi:hypothetical protein
VDCQTALKFIDDMENAIVAFGSWSDQDNLARVIWLISQLQETLGSAQEVRERLNAIEKYVLILRNEDGPGVYGGLSSVKKNLLANIESLRRLVFRPGECLS